MRCADKSLFVTSTNTCVNPSDCVFILPSPPAGRRSPVSRLHFFLGLEISCCGTIPNLLDDNSLSCPYHSLFTLSLLGRRSQHLSLESPSAPFVCVVEPAYPPGTRAPTRSRQTEGCSFSGAHKAVAGELLGFLLSFKKAHGRDERKRISYGFMASAFANAAPKSKEARARVAHSPLSGGPARLSARDEVLERRRPSDGDPAHAAVGEGPAHRHAELGERVDPACSRLTNN